MRVPGLRPNDPDIREYSIDDPSLGARKPISVCCLVDACAHGRWIAPGVWLRKTEAAHGVAALRRGNHVRFCSSEPNAKIGPITKLDWTPS